MHSLQILLRHLRQKYLSESLSTQSVVSPNELNEKKPTIILSVLSHKRENG